MVLGDGGYLPWSSPGGMCFCVFFLNKRAGGPILLADGRDCVPNLVHIRLAPRESKPMLSRPVICVATYPDFDTGRWLIGCGFGDKGALWA